MRGERPARLQGFASAWRTGLMALVVVAAFGGVGYRLVFLHVLGRDHYVQQAVENRRRVIEEPARRGDILDTRGAVLATTRTRITLGVDPTVLKAEDREKLPQLAELIGVPVAELEAACQPRTRMVRSDPADPESPLVEQEVQWVKVAEDLRESTYDQVRALGIAGVYGAREFSRAYPQHELASQLIGYVNKVGDPAMGVEAYMDFFLRGQPGWRESELDGRRRELAQFRSREVNPADGYSVTLSLDLVVQHMVERELAALVGKLKPAKATIIVSDPQTGFILALGNYPTFDPEAYNTAPLAAQKNMAVTDMVEPGSTFKIVTVAAAIEEGIVGPKSVLDTSITEMDYKGRLRRFIRDDHPFHEPATVADIIRRSSNVGTGQLALRLGDQKLYDYARAFGFGEEAGFPFGGEIRGALRPPREWSVPDITRIPSGYAIAATPLQIHYAMATIASGGVLMRPQIIREVRRADGEIVYRFAPQVRRRVISERTAAAMAEMLEGVATRDGTAPEVAIPQFEVAGKTGTAQKIIDGRYSTRHHVGSFSGFFPASRPRVVITVIVDDGRRPDGGAGYGRIVAAPSFKHLGEQLIQYLDIKPVAPVTAPASALAVLEGGRR